MSVLDETDRRSALDDFAQAPKVENTSIVPAGVFAAPAERVFGAQQVAVHRDESDILKKLKVMAAAAGEDWFYRFPVKKKNEDGTFATDYIEGPSIKCANNVARLYGNCDIDVRVFDSGTHWLFYARFMDLETGYSLVRPFNQRKGQKVMKTDADRQADIVFQIGASKAIRNVINNALEFFSNYAADEAKNSIIEKVGKKLEFYRDKVADRLKQLGVDIKRVETVRGRPFKDWLAADVARTIAELQAIADGMATADETYPIPGATTEAAGNATADARDNGAASGKDSDKSMDQFAGGDKQPAGTNSSTQQATPSSTGAGAATGQPASEATPQGGNPNGTVQQTASAAQTSGAGTAADTQQAEPKTAAAYEQHATAFIENAIDADALESKWRTEKALRNRCNVDPETRDELAAKVSKKAGQLRAAASNTAKAGA